MKCFIWLRLNFLFHMVETEFLIKSELQLIDIYFLSINLMSFVNGTPENRYCYSTESINIHKRVLKKKTKETYLPPKIEGWLLKTVFLI